MWTERMEQKIFENEYYRCWIEDGIMYSRYKTKELDLNAAMECVKIRLVAAGDRDYPTLIDGRGVSNVTKEARDYFGSEEGSKRISASAIITQSVVGKFIGSFFLRINKPIVPLKIFNDPGEAVEWLKEFKKE
jgi:hypothetical protein